MSSQNQDIISYYKDILLNDLQYDADDILTADIAFIIEHAMNSGDLTLANAYGQSGAGKTKLLNSLAYLMSIATGKASLLLSYVCQPDTTTRDLKVDDWDTIPSFTYPPTKRKDAPFLRKINDALSQYAGLDPNGKGDMTAPMGVHGFGPVVQLAKASNCDAIGGKILNLDEIDKVEGHFAIQCFWMKICDLLTIRLQDSNHRETINPYGTIVVTSGTERERFEDDLRRRVIMMRVRGMSDETEIDLLSDELTSKDTPLRNNLRIISVPNKIPREFVKFVQFRIVKKIRGMSNDDVSILPFSEYKRNLMHMFALVMEGRADLALDLFLARCTDSDEAQDKVLKDIGGEDLEKEFLALSEKYHPLAELNA